MWSVFAVVMMIMMLMIMNDKLAFIGLRSEGEGEEVES